MHGGGKAWDEAEASQQKHVLLSLKKLLRITAPAKTCITFHYIPKGQALQNPEAITFQLHEH